MKNFAENINKVSPSLFPPCEGLEVSALFKKVERR